MQFSEITAIIIGTLLFFGFAVWGAFYSRRASAGDQPQAGQTLSRRQKADETRAS